MTTETTNRIIKNVCFDKELFKKLESARGIATRSAFINQLLKEQLSEGA